MTRLLVVLACCLAQPAAAQAGSIVYIKDSNVWVVDMATGEGSQVTSDGTAGEPYYSPSQADDGTIVVAKGTGFDRKLHRMTQAGAALNVPFVPDLRGGTGPHEPQVSPDGSAVAYSAASGASTTFGGPGGSSSTLYSSSDRAAQAYESPGGFKYPSWISNTRTLVFSNSGWIHDVTSSEDARVWIRGSFPESSEDPAYARSNQDGEATRDGKRVATVFERLSDSSGYIQLYAGDGSFTTSPVETCRILGPDGGFATFADPTWSPDGTQLAWSEPGGIQVANVPATGCDISTVSTIAGSQPDWGPAAVDLSATSGGGAGLPVLSKLKVTATKITFTVSELSAGVFKFQRKIGKRFVAVKGKVQAAATAGTNTIRWKGKVGGRRLASGTYRVTGVAVNLDGATSKPVRATYVKR